MGANSSGFILRKAEGINKRAHKDKAESKCCIYNRVTPRVVNIQQRQGENYKVFSLQNIKNEHHCQYLDSGFLFFTIHLFFQAVAFVIICCSSSRK